MKLRSLGLLVALVACQGDGSDIGPRLAPIPSVSSKVSVLDDANRGVVGARVTIGNSSITALTGRNGRGDLLAIPKDRQLLHVDGSSAAATNGDLLGVLDVALSLSGGDIPTVFHLPDASQGGAASVNAGTQTAGTTLGHPASIGGATQISNGSSVGVLSGAATVTLRTGSLASHHLPGDLPAGALMSGGVYIDPPAITFTPGADISVNNDLLAAGPVTLYRLDSATGEWVTAGAGTAGGGLLQASAAVTMGGLYAFGVPVTTGSVRGRVVDLLGNGVPGALLSVGGRRAVANAAGVFAVLGVPAQNGDGSPHTAVLEVFAGGGWLPAVAVSAVVMNGATEVDAGDIGFDSIPCGNIRVQQVRRSRPEPARSARLSSLFGSVALATTTDSVGQTVFEDVPSQWFGFQDAFPKDRSFAYYSQAVGFAEFGRRWLDVYQFFDESAWFTGSRSSRVIATDSVGGGPLFNVAVVRGRVSDEGLLGYTREGGVLFGERSLAGRVTASVRTQRAGRTIIHAFSIDTPNGEHLETPLQQVLRAPLGAFDRHGLVKGTVTGATPTSEHRLRVTRRLELQEWWDDLVRGIAIPSSLPVDVDPAVTHGAYQAGLDRAGGNLVVAEVTTASGITTLQKLAVAGDVEPSEGAAIARDLPLDHVANVAFAAPAVLSSLDASIAPNTLTVALALLRPSGHAIDVVRGIRGNHTISGADLTLMLPALAGDLAGDTWHALLQGSAASAAGTIAQRTLLRWNAAGVVAVPPLMAAPTVTQPAPNAVVSSTGFSVQFSLPANVLYATLELRNDTGGELRLWEAFVPPSATEYNFTRMPGGAETPLISGKTYSLTVSAYGSSNGGGPLVDSNNPYRDLTTYIQSISSIERGVDAVSSVTIQVTTL